MSGQSAVSLIPSAQLGTLHPRLDPASKQASESIRATHAHGRTGGPHTAHKSQTRTAKVRIDTTTTTAAMMAQCANLGKGVLLLLEGEGVGELVAYAQLVALMRRVGREREVEAAANPTQYTRHLHERPGQHKHTLIISGSDTSDSRHSMCAGACQPPPAAAGTCRRASFRLLLLQARAGEQASASCGAPGCLVSC